ncbi:MAG TPA: ion transporter [Alkalispirochaeta sp.]|nr:ion transporter [Alkalispirochaeta sp.]
MSKTRSFLENIVIVAIVLVLIQTLLEDVAIILGWSRSARESLMLAGFVFDLFFTVEFLSRSYDAFRHRRFSQYLWIERGWIDFLAAVPLLVFNSGPSVIAWYIGGVAVAGSGGMLNVLKVVKAIRIARVLRLLRVLKIFRRIKNADSVMAQRHLATISAMVVTVFVFTLLLLSLAGAAVTLPTLDQTYQRQVSAAIEHIEQEQLAAAGNEAELARFVETHPGIISVEQGGSVRYARYDQAYLNENFRPTDYTVLEQGTTEIFVDLTPINREQAANNARYFVIIVAIILVLMLVYSPHFALTVSDPIHVMRRGLAEKNYRLEVRVPRQYRDDDVYRLANEYNRVYLPMKDREAAGEESSGTSSLTMGDVKDLFE